MSTGLVAVGTTAGLLGAVVALLALLRTRSRETGSDRDAAMKKAVESGLVPVNDRLHEVENRIRVNSDKISSLAGDQARVTGQLTEMNSRLAVMEAKIDVFWKNVAFDAAKILHSPHPERGHVDELLEAFMRGTITDAQKTELHSILEKIRDYTPGNPEPVEDFPVYPGEQVAAAILLRSMEYADK